jgi:hypothetical protein
MKELPRAPNNKASRASLETKPTHELILAFITWRMRLIPAKPRKVRLWAGGVTRSSFRAVESRLQPLLKRVEAGADLTPHLSDLVMTKGVVLPGANPADRGKDIDGVLTRHGLHHFHVGDVDPGNPKGRSGVLIFAEVLDKEFRIVATSDHSAFERGSTEQLRFFGICRAYVEKDIPHGQAYMANPIWPTPSCRPVTQCLSQCSRANARIKLRHLTPFLTTLHLLTGSTTLNPC